jgi:Subtilase family
MNGGGHSGETVLESGIDNLLRQPRVAVIKSAGNEQQWRIHAGGQIEQGETVALELTVQLDNREEDVIELWYDGADTISIALQPPGEPPLATVEPGGQQDGVTVAGNHVTIDFDTDADETGDTRATIILSHGDASVIRAGTWKLLLHGDNVRIGRYDAWIERARRDVMGEQTQFSSASANDACTISIPGTARQVITVGSYVTRPGGGFTQPALAGQISLFSSQGPTRYGLQKPELVAPGERIISTRSANSGRLPEPDQLHTGMSGTSMAAPHVTGAAALILSVRPNLTCQQVKQILVKMARRDGAASQASDNVWGGGKLDVLAAVEQARKAQFPQISDVRVNGATLTWTTDIPTASRVRFHTHQRKLQLGKALGSSEDVAFVTEHNLTLNGQPAGKYFCEIVATSENGWSTLDDNRGALYQIVIASVEEAQPKGVDLQLSFGNFVLEEIEARKSAQPGVEAKQLQARIPFQLVGALPSQTDQETSYFIQILAHELAANQTTVLAVGTGQLRTEQTKYIQTIQFPLPNTGRYQIMGTVILPNDKVIGVTMGPVLKVA